MNLKNIIDFTQLAYFKRFLGFDWNLLPNVISYEY